LLGNKDVNVRKLSARFDPAIIKVYNIHGGRGEMAPKITPEVMIAISRFLNTIKDFRGTNAELANRIAAGRANVVNIGGNDGGECFDILLRALGLPLSILGLSCDKRGASKTSVVAWATDLPGDAPTDIPRNVKAIDLYVGPERSVVDFYFDAGDRNSLSAGLASFGGRVDDLFIIAHGDWVPAAVISTKQRPPQPQIPRHHGESYFLSGIYAPEVLEICKAQAPWATIHICACDLTALWEEWQEKEYGISLEIGPAIVCRDYRPAIQYLYNAHGLKSGIPPYDTIE
jgi:hypothetical protein